MEPKYLLFDTAEVGLGHLFTAILHSAYYAWRTGRILALDMRRFHYVKENKHATFLENFGFDFPSDLQILTDLEQIDRLRQVEDLHYLTLVDRLNVDQPFPQQVLLVPCVTPGLPYTLEVKRAGPPFRIVLKGKLLEEWHRAMSLPQWQGPVIGLHYRSTVGEVTERMTRELVPDYDERYQAVQNLYADTALAAAREAGYANPAFLITSDDAAFVEGVKSRLPNAFSLATRLLDQEVIAYIRAQGHDIGILIDAVNDLWCLSQCDHLVHYRSGFSEFAILNSRKLNKDTTHYVHIPAFEEILRTLEPQQAVEWARMAVRKADARRMQLPYLHDWYADALERAGETEAAVAARRRAKWQWDATTSPIVDTAERRHLERQAWSGGDLDAPIANAERVVRELPGNPFVLAGHDHSLSNLLMKAGRLDEALQYAREAVAIEPDDAYSHQHLGDVLLRTHALPEAEHEFRRAIELEPAASPFHRNLSACLVQQNRIDEAIAAAREAVRIEPDAPHLHRLLGMLLAQQGDLPNAEAAFRCAIELGTDAGHYIDLSNVLQRQGRLDEAMEAVRTAIEKDPESSHWPGHLGHLLLEAGRQQEAEAPVRQAVALAKNDREQAAFRDLLAHVLERQERIDDALATLRDAAGFAPNEAGRHARIGNLLLTRTERFDEAAAAFRDAIALDETTVGYHDALSVALERAGQREAAAAAIRRGTEIDPDNAGRHARLGLLLLQTGEFAASADALRQAIERQPQDAGQYHLLSIALERQEMFDAAADAAARAVEMAPDQLDRRRHAAAMLMRANRLDDAEATLREAVSVQPDGAAFHDTLGLVLERQGRIDDAVAAAQRAAELEPDQPQRHARLGLLLLYRTDRLYEAEAALRAAVALRDEMVEIQDALSLALERQQRVEEAAEATRRATQHDPRNAHRYIRLGQLLFRARMREQAEAALREGIAVDPNLGPLHDALSQVLEELDRPDEAIGAMRDAVAVNAGSVAYHLRLGNLLLRAGEPAEAELEFRRAAEIDPGSAEAAERLSAFSEGGEPTIVAAEEVGIREVLEPAEPVEAPVAVAHSPYREPARERAKPSAPARGMLSRLMRSLRG
jgi:tetratricopeptide (TPR) repeat protein